MNLEKFEKYFCASSEMYHLFTLRCADGFSVSLCSLGASIRQMTVPSAGSRTRNIVLSFAEDHLYLGNALYAGATLAPAAGRISYGRLPLPKGTPAQLTKNENGTHTLHGGPHNGSFQNWTILKAECGDHMATVKFGLFLPDGLDGFPGNRSLTAAYTLTEDRTLSLHYEAVSDQDTYFNLSNHTYFNLTGDFTHSALNHVLQICAGQYIVNRPDFIPERTAPVDDTPFDFRRPQSPAAQISQFPGNRQLSLNQGYNHGFILDPLPGEPVLTCSHPDSPVLLKLFSDAPCAVFYSGGYIPKGLALMPAAGQDSFGCTVSAAQASVPSCALAFELQDYPDAPGNHGFPYKITPAGHTWQRNIRYQIC